ncbi:MAG TPA: helix-turn-helix transcriptional regulator [Anaerolineae bacterium]|nr:helix-turn-helix transcriptional regulator [Anaerolineae bacterium]
MVAPKIEHKAEVAARFRQALDAKGFARLSEAKRWLAREAGVSQEAVRKWLEGSSLPTGSRFASLAKLLGVDVAWLRDGVGDTGALTMPKPQVFGVEERPAPVDYSSALAQGMALKAAADQAVQAAMVRVRGDIESMRNIITLIGDHLADSTPDAVFDLLERQEAMAMTPEYLQKGFQHEFRQMLLAIAARKRAQAVGQ